MSNDERNTHSVSEREKWQADTEFRRRELDLKERDQNNKDEELKLRRQDLERSKGNNPLVVAIVAAALAGIANVVVSGVNDYFQRGTEAQKAESARILEMIKTADIDTAKTNLEFLMDTGLISDPGLIERVKEYLDTHPSPVLPAVGERTPNCEDLDIDLAASTPLHKVVIPPSRKCAFGSRNGFPVPDPECTPGAVHSEVNASLIANSKFRTACLRSHANTPVNKADVYKWYGLEMPKDNVGSNTLCELDHLIPLGLGGADSAENLWPQCGPGDVPVTQRYFRQKDLVESYLAAQVKQGKMNLVDAQKGIASDWTQYLDRARQARSAPVSSEK